MKILEKIHMFPLGREEMRWLLPFQVLNSYLGEEAASTTFGREGFFFFNIRDFKIMIVSYGPSGSTLDTRKQCQKEHCKWKFYFWKEVLSLWGLISFCVLISF